uniref:Uncharacterized protein n=1 Tax=Ditylenchus dipsaci TaxID=166011 RepID=A0A915DW44_9BILA
MSSTFEVSGEVQAEDNKQATSQKFESTDESSASESATSSPETAMPTVELLADDDSKTDATVSAPDPTPSSPAEESTGFSATALETESSASATLVADEKTDETVTDATPSPDSAKDSTDSAVATTAAVAESSSSTEEPMPELVVAPRFNRALCLCLCHLIHLLLSFS